MTAAPLQKSGCYQNSWQGPRRRLNKRQQLAQHYNTLCRAPAPTKKGARTRLAAGLLSAVRLPPQTPQGSAGPRARQASGRHGPSGSRLSIQAMMDLRISSFPGSFTITCQRSGMMCSSLSSDWPHTADRPQGLLTFGGGETLAPSVMRTADQHVLQGHTEGAGCKVPAWHRRRAVRSLA